MRYKLIIPGRLLGLNDLIKGHWATTHRKKTAEMKRIQLEARAQSMRPVTGKVKVTISCYEPNAKRDDDNVTGGAAKCILDALQGIGVLKGDGQKYVMCIKAPVKVDRENPRVEVLIEEYR